MRNNVTLESVTGTPANEPPTGRFLNAQQLAAQLGVSRRTLFNWRDRGLIPYIKLPGSRRVLFDADSVHDALHRQERGGNAL